MCRGTSRILLGCALVTVLSSVVDPRAFAQTQTGIPIEVGNGDVASFVAAITTLNAAGGGVIQLASNGQYSFTTPADWWYGPNALPAVTSAIVIEGNGSTLQRTTTDLAFRFFYVSGGFSSIPAGNLTLRNLTLTGGLAQGGKGGRGAYGGGGGAGLGGAIYNQGGVRLVGVILAQNAAKGGDGQQTGNEGASGGGGLSGDGGGAFSGGGLGDAGGGGGFRYPGTTKRSTGPNPGSADGGGFMGSEGAKGGTPGTSTFGGNGGRSQNGGGGGGGGYAIGNNGHDNVGLDGGAGAFAAGSGGAATTTGASGGPGGRSAAAVAVAPSVSLAGAAGGSAAAAAVQHTTTVGLEASEAAAAAGPVARVAGSEEVEAPVTSGAVTVSSAVVGAIATAPWGHRLVAGQAWVVPSSTIGARPCWNPRSSLGTQRRAAAATPP
jgi:hypothetical protein